MGGGAVVPGLRLSLGAFRPASLEESSASDPELTSSSSQLSTTGAAFLGVLVDFPSGLEPSLRESLETLEAISRHVLRVSNWRRIEWKAPDFPGFSYAVSTHL